MIKVVVVFQGSLTNATKNLLTINLTGTQCAAWGPFKKDISRGRGRGYPKIVTNGDTGERGMFKW